MQTPFATFIEAAEELQSRFEEKPTVPPLWMAELSPSANQLSAAWNKIAAECSTESEIPPLILFDVFNGQISNTTAVLPDKMLSECFEAVSSQPGWGSAFYAVFVWLRDPDGTKFDPMPLLAVKADRPTVEVEITGQHSIKILKKWARHVRRIKSRLEPKPAGRTPDPAENELGPLGQSKNNLPQTADVSEFYRLQKLKSWESKPKAEIHRAIARKNLKKSKAECTEGNLKKEVERVRKAIRDYEKKLSPQH